MAIGAQAAVGTGPRQLGRYELLAKIAAGGMAEVFLARQHGPMGFHKVVVVKTIHEHLAEQQDFIDMFLDEARVAALIKHHNVVDIYDLGVDDGTYFIAMEYIPGQALSKVMSLCHRTAERLDVMITADLIAAAAHGLQAAHNLKGITGKSLELVHRDVSPGNILVSYTGAVKLVDFGVSKSLGSISSSQSSVLKGKIGYASPEQLEDRPLDRRSDVFSLGVVLWESLVFERLFRGSSAAATVKKILDGNPPPPSSKRPEVPPELDEVCLKALARDPADRYQTAGEMRNALQRVMAAHNHHTDNEDLARFMREAFANERARELALLRELVSDNSGDDVEIELVEISELEAAGTDDDDDDEPEIITIEAEPDDDDDDDDNDDDDELELELVIEDDHPPLESDELEGESTTVDPEPPSIDDAPAVKPAATLQRRTLRRAAMITAAVLGLAFIAALVAGSGSDGPAAATRPTAAPATTAPESQPPPAAPTAPAAARSGGEATAPAESATTSAPVADRAPKTGDGAEAARLTALGDRAYAAGKSQSAKRHYKEALEAREDHAAALRGLALVYARAGRGKSARYYLNRYLRAAPEAGDAGELRRQVYNSMR